MTLDIDGSNVAGLIWIEQGGLAPFVPSFESLKRAHPGLPLYVGSPLGSTAFPLIDGVMPLECATLDEAVELVSAQATRHVLVVHGPVIFPPDFLDRALPAMDDDLRMATVSFLSNAAGLISVPNLGRPTLHQVGPHDETSITRALRTILPPPRFAPVPAPSGAAILVSRHALAATGGLEVGVAASPAFRIADFGLAAARRGFIHVVDGGTYCTRALDLDPYRSDPLEDVQNIERGYLIHRHPFVEGALNRIQSGEPSAIGLTLMTAATKIRGLRIAIDGRDIGDKEMGTQVQILSLVRELALRRDVSSVQLGIPGAVPDYARPYILSSKISLVATPDLESAGLEPADIYHRPSQPSVELPVESWRKRFSRVVVTLQDLIAYQVGAYHGESQNWLRYRDCLERGVSAVDGVVAISDDTVRHMNAECMPIDDSRVFVVPNGTDHLTGSEPEEVPAELVARGFLDQEYLLVLGTNYGHKNRDLAIRTWRLLRHSYPNHALVLAGAFVPTGSSRISETRAAAAESDLFVLPDVSSAERNWLVRHAKCVLYPTSAEGFGLVPFEAARFGTPTVSVRFSPPAELNPSAPVWAQTWSADELASAVGGLLSDPALAADQVRQTLYSADRFLWKDTAAGLVNAYRTLLSLPARP